MVSITTLVWNVENYIYRTIPVCMDQIYYNIGTLVVAVRSIGKTIEIVKNIM